MADKVKIGIIGCGNIAPAYVRGANYFEVLDLVACADIFPEKALAFSEEHGLKVMSIEELLTDDAIQIIINLTIPAVHAEVDLQVINAGKHVYAEKPLGIEREEGRKVVEAAKEAGVRVGSAPDTFLGGGIQTCRKLIDDGWIGEPVATTAFMMSHGPEGWHPNPDFYYQKGGGPMFDMGPYYLTALVNLLGPVSRVSGSTRKSFDERVATSEVHSGRRLPVEVPTHLAGTLDFASGPIGTVVMSFDIWNHHLPCIEIHGSEGSLQVPDPNTFHGPVHLWTTKEKEWREIPLSHSAEIGRGAGVADMAYAIQSGRPHRANGDLAFHVLDLMQAFGESSDSSKAIAIQTTVERPAMIPVGLQERYLDE